MTQPTNYFSDQYGSPTKNGVLIASDGTIQFVTVNANGQQVISSGAGGAGNIINVGAFANTTLLQAAYPAGTNLGNFAQVGTTPPYTQYTSNGSAWVVSGSGGGGAVSSVNGQTGAVVLTAAQLNALNLPLNWDATANNPSLQSGVAPAGNNSYVVTTAGTTNLDGISTWNLGDIAYFGALNGGAWQQISATYIGSTGSVILKGNGVGGSTNAVAGLDYAPPSLGQSAVPIGFPPSGTVGSNGALTVGTAFNSTYADGVWLFFPANSITGSNLAGYYFTVMSSTTVGQIYSNYLNDGTAHVSGVVAIPGTLTPFTGTTGSAYTANIVGKYIPGVSVPANAIGNNGEVTYKIMQQNNNSAGNKILSIYFGGALLGQVVSTTVITTSELITVHNRGKSNRQIAPKFEDTNSASGFTLTSVDTTAGIIADLNLTLGAATDWFIVEAFSVYLSPKA